MKNQQDKILALLQNAGTVGVNSYDLTYKHSCKQAPTRIKELREQGYAIVSKKNLNRSVNYILLGTPALNHTTLTPVQPRPLQSWEKPLEKYVGKDGRTYWREKIEPKQEGLL